MVKHSDVILEMKGINKVYPNGIMANRNVNLSLHAGEIHGLVGENGAGKTTLMEILFGLCRPEQGQIFLDGREVRINGPQSAIAHGIGMVHQHFMLVPSLTVAENIVLGAEPRRGLLLNKKKAIQITMALCEKYNLEVNPRKQVRNISVGTRQRVEILKAMYHGARILILDEPTSVLTPQEIQELFEELRQLAAHGNTIILITHKLNEIKDVCGRVTVMRGGISHGVFNVSDVSEEDISRIMVGRDVILKVNKEEVRPKHVQLKVRELVVMDSLGQKAVDSMSFSVRAGEILGVAGVEGNGQRELVNALTGISPRASGQICVCNLDTANMNIRDIRDAGVSHIPEDRMIQGAVLDLSVEMNLLACNHDSPEFNSWSQVMRMSEVRKHTQSLVEEYSVKCFSPQQAVGRLSGGNIQKVVVAREFSGNPKLIFANQPTRGVDVGATEFIRRRLVGLRDSGAAILLVSADLNEVLELSDGLIVMSSGKIMAYFEDTGEVDEEELGLYMLGYRKQNAQQIQRVCYE